MMEWFILAVLLLILLALQAFFYARERAQLINRIIAKNVEEMKFLDSKQDIDASPQEEDVPPEYISLDEMGGEDFNKIIKQHLGRESLKDKTVRKLKEKVNGSVFT